MSDEKNKVLFYLFKSANDILKSTGCIVTDVRVGANVLSKFEDLGIEIIDNHDGPFVSMAYVEKELARL